jgi:iron complex transport system ATP-binding protein
MSALLRTTDLQARLGGVEILRGLDLDLRPGQITAILGPNGAGKSTLLKCLTGLIEPSAGHVYLGDSDLTHMQARARAKRIGYLPQSPTIAWAVTVKSLVALGRTPHSGAFGLTDKDHHAVERALETCALQAFSERDVTTLSGGERARVLIARVLAGEPDWMLTDEPFGGLDPGHRLDVSAVFRRFTDAGGGIVITLHDLDTAIRLADRIIVLSDGRVIADGAAMQALTPEILARAYGITARVIDTTNGPIIEITGRV